MGIKALSNKAQSKFRLLLEPYLFAILVFRLLIGRGNYSLGMRYSISALIDYSKTCYKEGADFSFITTNESIENVSGGLSKVLIDLVIENESPNAKGWLLVGEAPQTGTKLASFIKSNFGIIREIIELETLLGKRWSENDFELDLCHDGVTAVSLQKFDVVVTQALLEHVFDPAQVLRNLVPLIYSCDKKDKNGILVLHTNNPLMPLHRWPVDTLRYYDDWFHLVSHYLPLDLLHLKAQGHNMFAVYRLR
jgi:hypothetical protein